MALYIYLAVERIPTKVSCKAEKLRKIWTFVIGWNNCGSREPFLDLVYTWVGNLDAHVET